MSVSSVHGRRKRATTRTKTVPDQLTAFDIVILLLSIGTLAFIVWKHFLG